MKNYIIGSGPAPEWCRSLLAPYRRCNGTTGYEFHGKKKDFELAAGDMLEKASDGKILVVRKACL